MQIDPLKLTDAIAKGVTEGNAALIRSFTESGEQRRADSQKVTELDKEVVLVKGLLMSLVGKGDGESGLVPRMERDMNELRTDVTKLNGRVEEVHTRLGGIESSIKNVVETQAKQAAQTSWTDGWRGVAAFFVALAAVFAVIGGIVVGVLWLARGVVPVSPIRKENMQYARPVQTLVSVQKYHDPFRRSGLCHASLVLLRECACA